MTEINEASSLWLHAWYDPLASLKTLTPLVRMGDLSSDGDMKLVVCDIERKTMKVYKGTNLLLVNQLLDTPAACCVIYADNRTPRIASIAVAAGRHVFIYRQLRPYKKWICPPVQISEEEQEIWDKLRSSTIEPDEGNDELKKLRGKGIRLSMRSIKFINIQGGIEEQTKFINELEDTKIVEETNLTCMEVLKKDSDEADAIGHLVVGTEDKQVYILPPDPSQSMILCKIDLPAVPVSFTVTGYFDVEWRVMVSCRDGNIYCIKNGDARGTAIRTGTVIEPGGQPVAMIAQDRSLWVATTNKSIMQYTLRGKKALGIRLDKDVSDISILHVRRAKVSTCLLVALLNGEIRLYKDNLMINSMQVDGPIHAMRFGQYGREDNTLILVHGQTGCMSVKILKRTADIEHRSSYGGPEEQDVPIPIPKMSKLYVEQAQYEREHAPEMHRMFQRDLCKLRLETARAYVKTLTDGHIVSIICM